MTVMVMLLVLLRSNRGAVSAAGGRQGARLGSRLLLLLLLLQCVDLEQVEG